jgi:hypothetical protein
VAVGSTVLISTYSADGRRIGYGLPTCGFNEACACRPTPPSPGPASTCNRMFNRHLGKARAGKWAAPRGAHPRPRDSGVGIGAGGMSVCWCRRRSSGRRTRRARRPARTRCPLPFGPGGAGLVSSIFTATCWPAGVVSTWLPSPPLVVRMSPFAAIARPSGSLIAAPDMTVMPADRGGPGERVGDRRDAAGGAVGDVNAAAQARPVGRSWWPHAVSRHPADPP